MRRLPIGYTGQILQLAHTKTATNQSATVTDILVVNIL